MWWFWERLGTRLNDCEWIGNNQCEMVENGPCARSNPLLHLEMCAFWCHLSMGPNYHHPTTMNGSTNLVVTIMTNFDPFRCACQDEPGWAIGLSLLFTALCAGGWNAEMNPLMLSSSVRIVWRSGQGVSPEALLASPPTPRRTLSSLCSLVACQIINKGVCRRCHNFQAYIPSHAGIVPSVRLPGSNPSQK